MAGHTRNFSLWTQFWICSYWYMSPAHTNSKGIKAKLIAFNATLRVLFSFTMSSFSAFIAFNSEQICSCFLRSSFFSLRSFLWAKSSSNISLHALLMSSRASFRSALRISSWSLSLATASVWCWVSWGCWFWAMGGSWAELSQVWTSH